MISNIFKIFTYLHLAWRTEQLTNAVFAQLRLHNVYRTRGIYAGYNVCFSTCFTISGCLIGTLRVERITLANKPNVFAYESSSWHLDLRVMSTDTTRSSTFLRRLWVSSTQYQNPGER